MAVQSTTTQLPVFAPNQVLRAEDLNNLAAYMDFQARLSRIFTIGIGPLNGLLVEPDCSADGLIQGISISPGFGISSDGHLFQIRERCVFSYIRKVPSGDTLYRCVEEALEPEDAQSSDMFELSEVEEGGFNLFNEFDINGNCSFAVVLVRCVEEIERRRCFTDCEAAGADRSASIRAVLVPSDWVTPQEGTGNGGQATVINFTQPSPSLRRFGYNPNTPNCIKLCGIHTWHEFYQAYWRQLQAVGTVPLSLISALNRLHADFRLKLGDTTDAQLGGRITERINFYSNGEAAYMNIQYLYAYLRDLLVAYRELVEVAEGMTVLDVNAEGDDELGGFIDAFPGHLVLGCLSGCGPQSPNPPNLRSLSIPSGIKDFGNPQRVLADSLYSRLVALTEKNTLPSVGGVEIRITPGLYRKNTLNGRAIPFYYQGISSEVWNSEQAKQFLSHRYAAQDANHPLLSEYCEYDFFRVEGHIGQPLVGALAEISKLRECYNIAFDIQQVRIGPGAELEMNQEPVFGEMDELYQNTRADVLCKLDELPVGTVDDQIATIRTALTAATFLRQLPRNDLPAGTVTDDCCGPVVERALSDDFANALNAVVNALNAVGANNATLRIAFSSALSIFQELVRKYHRMAQELERQRAFCGFAHQHPGLEHKGGVPKGGTLVLVYAYRFANDLVRSNVRTTLQVPPGEMRTDEQLIADASASGNEALIRYLQQVQNLTSTVVADFCLPYLCCSNAPVVRNEIRNIRAAINIEGAFCSDQQLRFTVSPEGGRMQFLVGNDERGSIDNLTGDEYFDIAAILNQANDYTAGRAIITLKYVVAGALVTESVVVYKRPNLAMQVVRGEVCYDGNCVPIGFNFTFLITNADNSPVDLNALTELVLAWGSNGVDLKTTDDFDDGQYTHCVLFEEAPNCTLIATLTAQNGVCPKNVNEVTLDLSSGATLSYRLPGDDDFNVLTSNDNIIHYPAGNMPPFMVLQADPAGGNLQFTMTNAQGQTFTASLLSALSSEDCNSRLYYLIFNTIATIEFLNATPMPPLTVDMIQNATEFPLGISETFGILAYTLPCLNSDYTITISPPVPPDAPEDEDADDNEVINSEDRDGQPAISVTRDAVGSVPAGESLPLPLASQQLLNQRQAANTLAFRNLEEADPTLGNAAGFRLAKQFLLKQGDAAKLSQDFAGAAESLLLGMNRAGAARKAGYEAAFTPLAHAYFDKVLALAVPAGPETETAWTTIAAKAADAGIDLAAVRKGWKAADLRKTIDKERVNALDKLQRNVL
ncbi:MAG: hypothetical protein KF852_03225 [Saprospiraceae bacterium]|nr:hypothetical protein [Saprospiraceae bacterium]